MRKNTFKKFNIHSHSANKKDGKFFNLIKGFYGTSATTLYVMIKY